ncbi:MAG TPA: futalosine hydrolase [bacterium]|nr:futalosine hydrolase [bacterium]
MSRLLAGIPLAEFALLHAAPIEGHGLEDLGVQALGVGKVAAALRCAGLVRERPHTRAVLLFGVAGAFPARHRADAPPAAIGDLAIVGSDGFGDEGVDTPDGFLDLGAMQLADVGPFPADPRLGAAAGELLAAPIVRGTTVSTCSGTDAASQRLRARTGADVETMEGAAVALVCRQFELPLLHVRAISNWTGDRDRGEWQLGAAVDAVQRAVRRLLRA